MEIIIKIVVRAIIVLFALVFGSHHIRGAIENFFAEKYAISGSHAVFTFMWMMFMARALLL